MSVDLVNLAKIIHDNISTISFLEDWYKAFPANNNFFYNNYKIYDNVINIDVKSFNVVFLRYINKYIKENIISEFIDYSEKLSKDKRVVIHGLLFKELSKFGIKLNEYMIAVRNVCLQDFIKLYKNSYRNIILYRINYDDIEFNILNNSSFKAESFVNKHFLNYVKYDIINHVVVLNKKDGVFYLSDSEICDIKYTSGWVTIPIYRTLLTEILKFIIDPNMQIESLHKKLNEIIEYTDNDQFFGFQDDPISKKYKPSDNVSPNVKNLFISNVMNKFAMLFTHQ